MASEKCQNCSAELFQADLTREVSKSTRVYTTDICEIIKSPSSRSIIVLSKALLGCDLCKTRLYDALDAPPYVRTEYARRSNGYSSSESLHGDEATIIGHASHARLEVKQVLKSKGDDGKFYTWFIVDFAARWFSAERSVLVFFETPPPRLSSLYAPSTLNQHLRHAADPFWAHVLVTHEAIELQERSVWSVRDQVRDIEENPAAPANGNFPDYRRLHDVARHAIHSCESLDVVVATAKSFLAQHDDFLQQQTMAGGVRPARAVSAHVASQLAMNLHILQGLKARAMSNKERLQNELNLTFNIVAQHDSNISVQIAQAVRADSIAMKTVSILGMVFLPATFISGVFGSNFFDFTPAPAGEGGGGTFAVSDRFWIFWVVAIPTTVLTIVIWYWWAARQAKKA